MLCANASPKKLNARNAPPNAPMRPSAARREIAAEFETVDCLGRGAGIFMVPPWSAEPTTEIEEIEISTWRLRLHLVYTSFLRCPLPCQIPLHVISVCASACVPYACFYIVRRSVQLIRISKIPANPLETSARAEWLIGLCAAVIGYAGRGM